MEVAEVMRVLTGVAEGPLVELSAELGGALLADAGLAASRDDGRDRVLAAIRDGRAAERFGRMIAAMGGPAAFVEDWARLLPEAPVIREVAAGEAGHVRAIDGEALGLAVVALGGGRQVESDTVDPAVGLSRVVRLGESIARGAPLALIHAAREEAADAAEAAVRAAISIGVQRSDLPALVRERIGG